MKRLTPGLWCPQILVDARVRGVRAMRGEQGLGVVGGGLDRGAVTLPGLVRYVGRNVTAWQVSIHHARAVWTTAGTHRNQVNLHIFATNWKPPLGPIDNCLLIIIRQYMWEWSLLGKLACRAPPQVDVAWLAVLVYECVRVLGRKEPSTKHMCPQEIASPQSRQSPDVIVPGMMRYGRLPVSIQACTVIPCVCVFHVGALVKCCFTVSHCQLWWVRSVWIRWHNCRFS